MWTTVLEAAGFSLLVQTVGVITVAAVRPKGNIHIHVAIAGRRLFGIESAN